MRAQFGVEWFLLLLNPCVCIHTNNPSTSKFVLTWFGNLDFEWILNDEYGSWYSITLKSNIKTAALILERRIYHVHALPAVPKLTNGVIYAEISAPVSAFVEKGITSHWLSLKND